MIICTSSINMEYKKYLLHFLCIREHWDLDLDFWFRQPIKDLSTILTISGSRNRTIFTISGSRKRVIHFYDFWIQKYNLSIFWCLDSEKWYVSNYIWFCSCWFLIFDNKWHPNKRKTWPSRNCKNGAISGSINCTNVADSGSRNCKNVRAFFPVSYTHLTLPTILLV